MRKRIPIRIQVLASFDNSTPDPHALTALIPSCSQNINLEITDPEIFCFLHNEKRDPEPSGFRCIGFRDLGTKP